MRRNCSTASPNSPDSINSKPRGRRATAKLPCTNRGFVLFACCLAISLLLGECRQCEMRFGKTRINEQSLFELLPGRLLVAARGPGPARNGRLPSRGSYARLPGNAAPLRRCDLARRALWPAKLAHEQVRLNLKCPFGMGIAYRRVPVFQAPPKLTIPGSCPADFPRVTSDL